MTTGVQKTEHVLARSRNRAVVPVLAAALQSSSGELRAAAIRATLRRLDIDSHTQLIRHFAKFTEAELHVLCEAHRAMPHHAAPALKAAVLEGDAKLCGSACRIIVLCRAYDLFPALVKAADNPHHCHAVEIKSTIRQLAELLHEEIARWAAGDRTGRDPSFARHQLLAALERSLQRHDAHHPDELVDSFLLLAPSENRALLEIMQDAHHPAHSQLVATLSSGDSPAIMKRLVALVRDTEAPIAALEAIARRTDLPFVEFLLHDLKYPVPLRVLHNMQRLRSVAWLQSHRDILLEFDGRAQAIAVELATASNIHRDSLLELLAFLLQSGLAEGRRSACQALAKFERPEANSFVLAALDDPDAGVQAAAARQLRPRRLPNALQILVSLLGSPLIEVRDAARSSLAEFNFVRYRSMFDLLDEHAVRTTGTLVRQVDHTARQKLIAELMSPSISSRLRGMEMAVAMGAVDDVREQLIKLTRHENAVLRQEAVAALGHATGSAVIEALELAARDANHSVADAARQSLAQIRRSDGRAVSSQNITVGGELA